MTKRRRPFKARAWSTHFNEYVWSSFATRERARARATLYLQAGLLNVRVWEEGDDGAVVGTIERVTEP